VQESRQFVNDFVLYNHLTRVADEIHRSGPTAFYLHPLVFGLFPWSCLVPVALAGLASARRPGEPWRVGPEAFLLVASAVTFAAFSLSVTKFEHYLSPMMVPLGVTLGLTLDRLLRAGARGTTRFAWAAAGLLYLPPLLDVLRKGGTENLVSSFTTQDAIPKEIATDTRFVVILVAFGALLLLLALTRSRWLVAGLIAAAALFAHHANAVFIPSISEDKTMKGLCGTWKAEREPGALVGFHGSPKDSVWYYCSQIHFLKSDELPRFLDPARPAHAIVQRNRLATLNEVFHARYPGHSLRVVDDSHMGYALIGNQ
jgi:hypothetical protein